MSVTVFRNSDTKAIKALLGEIGRDRYYCALKDAGLSEMKPLTMDGFYLEFHTGERMPYLYYRYPSGAVFQIMSVLGFWRLPAHGWEMVREVSR